MKCVAVFVVSKICLQYILYMICLHIPTMRNVFFLVVQVTSVQFSKNSKVEDNFNPTFSVYKLSELITYFVVYTVQW